MLTLNLKKHRKMSKATAWLYTYINKVAARPWCFAIMTETSLPVAFHSASQFSKPVRSPEVGT